jgi:hypothetical protein
LKVFFCSIYCAYVCEYGVAPSLSLSLGERFVGKREDADEKGEQERYCPPQCMEPYTWGISLHAADGGFVFLFSAWLMEPPALFFFWIQRGRLYMAFTVPRGKHFQRFVGVLGLCLIDAFSMDFSREGKGGGGVVYGPVSFSFYVPHYYVLIKGCGGGEGGGIFVCLFFCCLFTTFTEPEARNGNLIIPVSPLVLLLFRVARTHTQARTHGVHVFQKRGSGGAGVRPPAGRSVWI